MALFIAFGCLIFVFTVLHFASAIVASRMMADLEATPVGAEIKRDAEDRQRNIVRSFFFRGGDIFGFSPMNENVWIAIFNKIDGLPLELRGRALRLRLLRRLQIGVWACVALLMLGSALGIV